MKIENEMKNENNEIINNNNEIMKMKWNKWNNEIIMKIMKIK